MFALGHKLGQEGAGPEEGLVGELLGPALNDEVSGVQSDVVRELWK